MMRKIVITLEITDPETVADYWDIAQELVYDDLYEGSLISECELVSVKMVENG